MSVHAGRGISPIIEASEKGLPELARKMEINAVPAGELAKFADAAPPAVKQLIEDKFGQEGIGMPNALLADIARARQQ